MPRLSTPYRIDAAGNVVSGSLQEFIQAVTDHCSQIALVVRGSTRLCFYPASEYVVDNGHVLFFARAPIADLTRSAGGAVSWGATDYGAIVYCTDGFAYRGGAASGRRVDLEWHLVDSLGYLDKAGLKRL